MGQRIVTGYQRDVRKRLVLALVPGALAWTLGALALLFGLEPVITGDPARYLHNRPTFQPLVVEAPRGARPIAPLVGVGALLCLASPFLFALGLRRSLDNDCYLLLCAEGLVSRKDGRASLYLWDEIEDAKVDEAGRLLVCFHDDTFFALDERWVGASTEEIVRKIREIRRKALWGLLPR